MEDKEAILRRGWVEVHAVVGGIRQLNTLNVKKERTMWGTVPYLVCDRQLPHAEVIRIAEELQLPVKAGSVSAFPRGKSPKDFALKEEKPLIKIQ